ncbi:MAG: D-2-hydroxyacid dehydrogenase [Gammaproteobacteria bacterium]|nr:MAG: D-2-hydroxyacid dehydrogenase [Gammaproteobacteria bacterium]
MQGVFLDLDSVHPSDLDLAQLQDSLPHWQFHHHTGPDEVLPRIQAAQVVVTNKVPLTASSIQASGNLQLICVAATGTNNIDLAAASAAGVVVSNARDYATASVVEHVFSLLLTLTRRLDAYRRRVRDGDWTRSPHFCLFDETIEELAGKQLGIIGYGVLGRAVADLARAFSMQVNIAQRVHDSPLPDRLPLPQLLESCDVISLHCPLTEQTRGLIGETELRQMKDTALLINTARGGIVDEQALLRGLQQGWIAGAGIDVLAEEPPATTTALLQYNSPRLIVTPHIAWASRAARQRLIGEITANILAFGNGSPRNRVC